jgi:hypothetical protein
MDSFIVICLVISILGGSISGMTEIYRERGIKTQSSKNIFTFLFCDKY